MSYYTQQSKKTGTESREMSGENPFAGDKYKQRLIRTPADHKETSPCALFVRLVEVTSAMGKQGAAHMVAKSNMVSVSAAAIIYKV